jgi:hypothetical protein
MWRKLKNLVLGVRTYADMSPDLGLRRRIVRTWQARPDRTLDAWYGLFWQSSLIAKDVATFVYIQMADYSGLPFAKVLPSDRLEADLNLSLVCWFNWQSTLCEDFAQRFGVDISHCFDPDALNTVEDLMVFLNRQLATANYSSAKY